MRLKKYLYVLRPLLASLWIEQDRGVAPMRRQDLVDGIVNDGDLRAAIDDLLAVKRTVMESEYGQSLPIINVFLDGEMWRLEATSPPVPRDTDFSVLDALLMDTVVRFEWPGRADASKRPNTLIQTLR